LSGDRQFGGHDDVREQLAVFLRLRVDGAAVDISKSTGDYFWEVGKESLAVRIFLNQIS